MNCDHIQTLLQAHHDGELDAANTLEVERHLADCPRCFDATRRLATLRTALSEPGLRFTAPTSLRRSISAAAEQAEAAERPAPHRAWPRAGLSLAAAAAAIAVFATLAWPRPAEDPLLAELTGSHIRSLMAMHLTDVPSSDQHTVKPWFDGKLDFAPTVKDLRDQGFPLIGGRLDYLAERPVAALVYGRQKHFINLFIWPSTNPGPAKPRAASRHGYHLVHWADQSMTYWAVSDLNEKELLDFAELWPAG